jgi:hypothetical protein
VADKPVCNCLTSPLLGSELRLIRVFDPFCQVAAHRAAGTYTGPLPAYEPAGSGGDVG